MSSNQIAERLEYEARRTRLCLTHGFTTWVQVAGSLRCVACIQREEERSGPDCEEEDPGGFKHGQVLR